MLSPTCFEPLGFILRKTVVYAVWYVLRVSVWGVSNTHYYPPDCSHRCI